MTPVPGSLFAAGLETFSVAVDLSALDPAANFTIVANALGNNVSAYRISSNGALVPVPGSPFEAGIEPASVAISTTRP